MGVFQSIDRVGVIVDVLCVLVCGVVWNGGAHLLFSVCDYLFVYLTPVPTV